MRPKNTSRIPKKRVSATTSDLDRFISSAWVGLTLSANPMSGRPSVGWNKPTILAATFYRFSLGLLVPSHMISPMTRRFALLLLVGLSLDSAGRAESAASGLSPAVLPGHGLAQHPFLYAGEW